jgi:hypothetical protein
MPCPGFHASGGRVWNCKAAVAVEENLMIKLCCPWQWCTTTTTAHRVLFLFLEEGVVDFVGAADKGCDDSRVSWASLKIDNERERHTHTHMRWLKTLWSMRMRVGVFLLLWWWWYAFLPVKTSRSKAAKDHLWVSSNEEGASLSVSVSVCLSLCRPSFVFSPLGRLAFVRQNGASELPDLLFLVFSVLQILLFYEVSEGSCRSLGMLFVFLRYGYYYFEHLFFLYWCRIRVPRETLA